MNAMTLSPVSPVRPIAPYIGGKRNLARRLCALIEATPHTTYAEAFVGMGGVFFRRKSRPKCELINDWSGDVANLFRCMRATLAPSLTWSRCSSSRGPSSTAPCARIQRR